MFFTPTGRHRREMAGGGESEWPVEPIHRIQQSTHAAEAEKLLDRAPALQAETGRRD